MSASNRSATISKIHRVVKRHYKPVVPPANRSVLEHLLYASCLENAPFETADESFAKLQQTFFNWNEVRVTTVTELAEVMSLIPDALHAAERLKRILQSVFETHYEFDLEFLKKQALGKAVKDLEKYHGVSQFGADYLIQNALGGHAIPLGDGAMEVLYYSGAINDQEFTKRAVPGMDRAIPKSKGIEFFSLLHQLGVDIKNSPSSSRIRAVIAEIEPKGVELIGKAPAIAPPKKKEPEPKIPTPPMPVPTMKSGKKGEKAAADRPPEKGAEKTTEKGHDKGHSKAHEKSPEKGHEKGHDKSHDKGAREGEKAAPATAKSAGRPKSAGKKMEDAGAARGEKKKSIDSRSESGKARRADSKGIAKKKPK